MTSRSAQMLLEFHTAFGLPVNHRPSIPDSDEENLRADLLDEEFSELTDALFFEDLVEIADALADILYIAEGTALVYGVRISPDHPVGQSSVMGPPRMPTVSAQVTRVHAELSTEVAKASEAQFKQKPFAVQKHLSNVRSLCYQMAGLFDINLDVLLEEVHRANMSKLGPDGKPIYRADGKVLKPKGWTAPDVAGVLGIVAEKQPA